MDRHKRMARTLFFLVAAMTAGAAMLDWSQPARQAQRQPIELIARGAENGQPWDAIRIRAHHGELAEHMDTHFFIDREGGCLVTGYWRNQHRFNQQPVVHVGLEMLPHSNLLTDPQWMATQSLIQTLQQVCVGGDAVSIDVDDSVAPTAISPRFSASAH
jgi:hypothetical protein